jgi:hypothetical protein
MSVKVTVSMSVEGMVNTTAEGMVNTKNGIKQMIDRDPERR